MRIIALSLDDITPSLTAACHALRYAGHTVDVYRKRTFGDSLRGYTAAMISLGDWTDESADRIKLAAARTAIELSTCYFFDRPPFRSNPEDFWRSALFGETANEMIHRSEMLKALKSPEWRPKIEEVVARWNNHETLPAIWPGRDWITGPFETPPNTSAEMPAASARKLSAMFLNKIRETKAKALTR